MSARRWCPANPAPASAPDRSCTISAASAPSKRALRSAEQRFQRFFDEAPIGIVLIDHDGRLEECNTAFRAMVGVRVHDLIGHQLLELHRRAGPPGRERRLTPSSPAARRACRWTCSLKSPQGERSATLYVSRREEATGQGSGWIAHFIDITERKKLEVQFAQSQKMQAVGQLAGGIAHDFNNLLTAMIGFCDLLLVRHRAGDQSFADIMQIKQNANRAANLVRQLLAFSRQQTLQPRIAQHHRRAGRALAPAAPPDRREHRAARWSTAATSRRSRSITASSSR